MLNSAITTIRLSPSAALTIDEQGRRVSLYGLADEPVLSADRLLAQPVRLLVLGSLVDVKLHQLHSSLLDYAEDLLQLPLFKILQRQIPDPLHPSLHALR